MHTTSAGLPIGQSRQLPLSPAAFITQRDCDKRSVNKTLKLNHVRHINNLALKA